MNIFEKGKRSIVKWAQGSPPMNEKVYQTIHKEFHIVLYLSGLFLDLRPRWWIFTLFYVSVMYPVIVGYVWLAAKTVFLQIADFPRAAETSLLGLIVANAMIAVVHINFRRSDFVGLFHAISQKYFDYEDGEEILEMRAEEEKSRRQKIFVLVVCPMYLTTTAVLTVCGRSMDVYFGAVTDEAYENGVYMLTPRPVWFPFAITNRFTHYLAMFSQVCVAGAIAAYYAGYLAMVVVFSQSLALQLKLLKYRIRKIPRLAYKLHKKTSGNAVLDKRHMYDDPNFRKCYNIYMSKCAAHHAIIVRNFNHFRRIHEWECQIGLILITIMMAISLLLLLIEKSRPSIISFGCMILLICVVNIGFMTWQTEHVAEVSNSISRELYDSNWVDVDQSSRKTMIIMIERIKQPLVLNAAISHTALTWETYSAMLNSAYSYVNVLRAARMSE